MRIKIGGFQTPELSTQSTYMSNEAIISDCLMKMKRYPIATRANIIGELFEKSKGSEILKIAHQLLVQEANNIG